MEERQAAGVLGHQHEGRRDHGVAHAEAHPEALGELGLARAEIPHRHRGRPGGRRRPGGRQGRVSAASRVVTTRSAGSGRGHRSEGSRTARPPPWPGADRLRGGGQTKRSRSPIATRAAASSSTATRAASSSTSAANRRGPDQADDPALAPAWTPLRIRTRSGRKRRQLVGLRIEDERRRIHEQRDLASRRGAPAAWPTGPAIGRRTSRRGPGRRTAVRGEARPAGGAPTPGSRAAPCRGASRRRSHARPSHGPASAPPRRSGHRPRGCCRPAQRRSRLAAARQRGRWPAPAAHARPSPRRTRRAGRARRPARGSPHRAGPPSPRHRGGQQLVAMLARDESPAAALARHRGQQLPVLLVVAVGARAVVTSEHLPGGRSPRTPAGSTSSIRRSRRCSSSGSPARATRPAPRADGRPEAARTAPRGRAPGAGATGSRRASRGCVTCPSRPTGPPATR